MQIFRNKLIMNTIMLYLLTFAKMFFPFFTLPYLTRILSIDGYAVVAYVKAMMVYFQIYMDFGFGLSATKEIVRIKDDKNEVSKILGSVLGGRIILALLGFIFVFLACRTIELLKPYLLYSVLSYIAIALTAFLPDYLFRGIERMQTITIRFVIMRSISTVLTFVFVKDDSDLIVIPILDIVGTIAAVIWTWLETKKLGYGYVFGQFSDVILRLKESSVYFISELSTAVFGAFNTLIIGIYLPAQEIAMWSVASTLVTGVTSLYTPITGAVYPRMVSKPDLKLIRNILLVIMPIIVCGMALSYYIGEWVIVLIAGEKYRNAFIVLNWLLPLFFLAFPVMLIGWPCLGAIDKQKEVTFSTVFAAIVQVGILCFVIFLNYMSLIAVALSRIISEICLLLCRAYFLYRYRGNFSR